MTRQQFNQLAAGIASLDMHPSQMMEVVTLIETVFKEDFDLKDELKNAVEGLRVED